VCELAASYCDELGKVARGGERRSADFRFVRWLLRNPAGGLGAGADIVQSRAERALPDGRGRARAPFQASGAASWWR
jgi:hypothetical protein